MSDHHHHEGREPGWFRGWSPAEFISNWNDYEGPLGRKMALAARNLALRARLRPCCGHPGEPGC